MEAHIVGFVALCIYAGTDSSMSRHMPVPFLDIRPRAYPAITKFSHTHIQLPTRARYLFAVPLSSLGAAFLP